MRIIIIYIIIAAAVAYTAYSIFKIISSKGDKTCGTGCGGCSSTKDIINKKLK